ncbi:Mediator of RNA polymerase II transcription subunit 23 [Wickerhamomyces ciferrii]|uniref:Mediator of RNA polymerase II transcription subunit 23 n=1 Tax=Wickerhamomyces ciferrii (strain ATCC 14091 / BCRC 22168 / CBS 111 / JCM 3599 / NBRC 0793 / NRRL Y-1031 F-60-10) TaxID=1206466 RepID=K0KIK4_WICCF|nr:Mediator of RNA polymerase II transcription subunit 23 [Wickerhamomyces ciferrii]CCH42806.1 Mediator of RNA polymerase II transcription subunit 23 [Wickerhamomyces ciferrii]
MRTTLPGINQLPSLQSFGAKNESVHSTNVANSANQSNNYFEYKPAVYKPVPPTSIPHPQNHYEFHSNYSYQSAPQVQYMTTSSQIIPQYTLQATGNTYTPGNYHQPLSSPLDTPNYNPKIIRSGSSDSTMSSGSNSVRLPSIHELVSPASATSSPPAYHPIPQHQQFQQFQEQQQRVLQQPRAVQMQQPTVLHHHNHHPNFNPSQPIIHHHHVPLQQDLTISHNHHNHVPTSYSSPAHTIHHLSQIQPKKIRKRTRTGCLTCRKRRIKCDERKPSCLNCEKSKKCCAGYVDVIKKNNRKSTNTTTTQAIITV